MSKYIGVSKCQNKWKSMLHSDNKHFHLGLFEEEIDAAKAYNDKALELHGENAKLNVITETSNNTDETRED